MPTTLLKMFQRQRSFRDSDGDGRKRKSVGDSKIHQMRHGSSTGTLNFKFTTTSGLNTYGGRTNENTASSVNNGEPPLKKTNFRIRIVTLPAIKTEPVDDDSVICVSYPTKVKVEKEDETCKGLLSNLFYCHHCNFIAVRKDKLRAHTQRHLPPSFFCKHCPYKTYSKTLLKSHSMRHRKQDKPFACELCDYKCSWKQNLKEHTTLVHNEDRPYSCPFCPFKGKLARIVREHVKRHTGVRDVKCPYEGCSHTAYNNALIKEHVINRHTEEKPFACPACDYRAKHKSNIEVHYRYKHERILKYSCPHCDYRSAIKSNLTSHIRSHSEARPYQCSLCEGWFRSSGTLKTHCKNVHENARLYECFHCDFRANTRSGVRAHIEEIHLKLKPFKCQLCEYRAFRSAALRRHVERVHGGPDIRRPFACSKCESKFHEKRCLEQHMAVHTDSKPYKCSLCDYRGKTRVHLKAHCRDIHQTSNRDKYECQSCKFRTHRGEVFRDHLLVHSGETPFKCTLCTYEAARKSSMKRHMTVKHGES